MKSYHLLELKRYPSFESYQREQADSQLPLLPDVSRSPVTQIIPLIKNYDFGFERYEIRHEVKKRIRGRIPKLNTGTGNYEDYNFREFLHPIEFNAYIHRDKSLMVLRVSKDDGEDFIRTIFRDMRTQIKNGHLTKEIERHRFDFKKLRQQFKRLEGAWFKDVNSNIRSASIMGHDVHEDDFYQQLDKKGELTNVTIPYEFSSSIHKVMITKHSSVCLIEKYERELDELELVLNTYDQIIKPNWTT